MRIIAGRLGGRVLKAPKGDATRPTGARAREALFAVLGDLEGARVLDLYAGSGALGIEALSRGASSAVFVEAARPALACLKENLEVLGLGAEVKVLARRVETSLASLRELAPFDLVFCDAPWRDCPAALVALERLASAGLFAANARVTFEHAARDALSLTAGGPLLLSEERRWGDTGLLLLELRANSPENQASGRSTRPV